MIIVRCKHGRKTSLSHKTFTASHPDTVPGIRYICCKTVARGVLKLARTGVCLLGVHCQQSVRLEIGIAFFLEASATARTSTRRKRIAGCGAAVAVAEANLAINRVRIIYCDR